MRSSFLLLFLLGFYLNVSAQDFSKLPQWAANAAMAAQSDPGPENAEAWILLDRTEIAYTGDGEIRLRRMQLLKILEERGTRYRTFMIYGLGGKASRVKRLKGWNLRPDGELAKLDLDSVVTANDATEEEFSTTTFTGGSLGRVMKGSLVAFESLESIQSPLGPVAHAPLMGALPIRVWELEVAKQEGWFTNLQSVEIKIDRRSFHPWIPKAEELPGGGLRVLGLRAIPTDEGAHPDNSEVLPIVQVRFLDPKQPIASMWGSWGTYAAWVSGVYQAKTLPSRTFDSKGKTGVDGLRTLWNWMRRGLTYKQVYLSPERGWIPELPVEVGRKRYGDCKDLTTFLLAEAKVIGLSGAPVLARIGRGGLAANEPPFPRFNHVIAGIKLEASLGLPAEVETSKGRFLLVDPTDFHTPIGFLSGIHAKGRVMICLPSEAVWVEVPDRAIFPERLSVELKGDIVDRELRGTMTMNESGNSWGLRSAATQGGAKAIHDLLLKAHLDLPPAARSKVVSFSDPMDLDHPLEVVLSVTHPSAFRIQSQEGYLTDLGIPWVPGTIQRVNKPRQYPVESLARGELSYRAELKFAVRVKPILPARSGESPFRSFTWTSQAVPDGGGTMLKMNLEHRYIPAQFSYEVMEQGLKAWKQDRSLMKSLRDDALAVRIGQP